MAGVVSVKGCNIHLDVEWSEIQSAGPIARHAKDLAPIIAVLVGDKANKLSLDKRVGAVKYELDHFLLHGIYNFSKLYIFICGIFFTENEMVV